MIEITFADMFLLLWAILATVFCIFYREQEASHRQFIGCLELVKQQLINESLEDDED